MLWEQRSRRGFLHLRSVSRSLAGTVRQYSTAYQLLHNTTLHIIINERKVLFRATVNSARRQQPTTSLAPPETTMTQRHWVSRCNVCSPNWPFLRHGEQENEGMLCTY